jgi:WD40 repeat protein
VLVWDGRDARLERAIESRSTTGLTAVCSADAARIAFPDGPGGVTVLEFATGTERHFDAHAGELTALRFSPDGLRLATGGSDRTVCSWDVRPDTAPRDALQWRSQPFEAALVNLNRVFDVAFSSDGRLIAAAEQGTRIEVFDELGQCIALTPQMATPGFVVFATDRGLLLGGSKYGRTTTMWRFPGLEAPAELENLTSVGLPGEHHGNSVTALAKARDAGWAVSGSLDRTAHLWDLDVRRAIASFAGHADAVFDVDIDPSGTWILTGSGDGTARLWPRDLLATARGARPDGYATLNGAAPDPPIHK